MNVGGRAIGVSAALITTQQANVARLRRCRLASPFGWHTRLAGLRARSDREFLVARARRESTPQLTARNIGAASLAEYADAFAFLFDQLGIHHLSGKVGTEK
jgi:hypothetical protein